MWSRKALVSRAINFSGPSRIPLWTIGNQIDSSDVFTYDLSLPDAKNPRLSEWGFERKKSQEGFWILPETPVLPTWDSVDEYTIPSADIKRRFAGIPQAAQNCGDRYRLASFGLSGFSIYRALRGPEQSGVDFLIETNRFLDLMDRIFDFERPFFDLLARKGFHGVEFVDDWIDRNSSRMTLSLWRNLLKARYAHLLTRIKEVGLQVWFSISPQCGEFFGDLAEIGVDVVRIDSPYQMELAQIGRQYRGKLAFAVRLDEMFHNGTVPEAELEPLISCLSHEGNGFIAFLSERATNRGKEKVLARLKKISG